MMMRMQYEGSIAAAASPLLTVLHTLSDGLYRDETLEAHVGLGGSLLLASDRRLLYVKKGKESARDDKLVRTTLWALTLAPVLHWHAELPREFEWFTGDDFIMGLPAWVGSTAIWLQLLPLSYFIWRRFELWRSGASNPMVPLLVLTTGLCWNMGIVWFNDDRVFTLTNVFLHGVPYLALVWLSGGRERCEELLPSRARASRLAVASTFYILLLALAVFEEGLWDQLLWHERGELFGDLGLRLEGWPIALVVALLTVPQGTHYILDRWIWRPGPSNPKLAEQLGLRGPSVQ